VALNDLDHALGRGFGYLTYVRYLDDMVVLTFDSHKGRRWADRALERIRQEAAAIGVSLNTEKTRTVTLTAPDTLLRVSGLHDSWQPNPTIRQDTHTRVRGGRRSRSPTEGPEHAARQPASLDAGRRRTRKPDRPRMGELLPSRQLEPRARRRANRRRAQGEAVCGQEAEAKGLGWARWSSETVYGSWGLFNDYRVRYHRRAKAAPTETDS